MQQPFPGREPQGLNTGGLFWPSKLGRWKSQDNVRQVAKLQEQVHPQGAEEIQAEVELRLLSCLHTQRGEHSALGQEPGDAPVSLVWIFGTGIGNKHEKGQQVGNKDGVVCREVGSFFSSTHPILSFSSCQETSH